MWTITEAGRTLARKFARRVTLTSTSVLAVIGFMVGVGFANEDVESSVRAVRGQLSNLLGLGDTFQIKAVLRSLVDGRHVTHYILDEPSGLRLAGRQDREEAGGEVAAWTSCGTSPLAWGEGRLHIKRRFELSLFRRPPAVLCVSRALDLRYVGFILLAQVATSLLVRWRFERQMVRFATTLTEPIARLASSIGDARSDLDLKERWTSRRELRYRELDDTLDSFLRLSERLRHEEDRRKAAEFDAAFSNLASQVAHDIRSPLSALNILLERVRSKLDGDEVDVLASASRRITGIADDLLLRRKSRPDRSPPARVRGTFDLGQLVRQMVREKTIEHGRSGGTRISCVAPEGPFPIEASWIDVSRVVSNLVNNGVEALDGRGGLVELRLTRERECVRLIVRDDGPGVSPDLLPRLGKERVRSQKTGSAGSGQGLVHASDVMLKHGGSLSIESAPSAGTRIILTFPDQRVSSTPS